MLRALLSQLVAIDSVNPSLVPGGAGEAEMAAFVAGWARGEGLSADVLEATPGRPSVIVRARGSGGGRTLLLCGHTDTVGPRGPHAPRVEGGRMYGRGAYDMKAGLAAALVAAREAARLDLHGDVVVAAVADEEHASLGVQEALRHVRADAAIVTEPTQLELIVAHKGFVWSELRVTGRAAHGSRPDLGEDAIVAIGPMLTALGALDQALRSREHPLLGPASVHASTIAGGTELSSYPAECVLQIERRTLPGESAAHVERELAAVAAAGGMPLPPPLRAVVGGGAQTGEVVVGAAAFRTLLVRDPFAVDPGAEVVGLVRDAAAAELASPPPLVGAPFWADSAFLAAAGIPTVLFGPGGDGAHADVEWVSLPETEAVARILTAVAARLCA